MLSSIIIKKKSEIAMFNSNVSLSSTKARYKSLSTILLNASNAPWICGWYDEPQMCFTTSFLVRL